ncbi:MAG: Gfo/Idh/MocA family oxidoreductase [Acidobacteria bacterium]|nr:Gfo/Idh/MocA family oxidoreductase [Acidobacteriota bacterium]
MSEIAVVGCGYWGKNLVRNFHELGALRAVCDTDPARLGSLRDKFPETRSTTSFAEVLKDDGVAGVAIATPAGSHYALAREALLADKDVLVEKPLALKISEGRGLVELAARRGRILMVGHILRYHPAVTALKALIDEGKLGKILYIYSNRLNLGRFRTEENILWSFAPHDLSAILYLLGEMPSTIAAHGGSYVNEGIPDVTVTTLGFRNGVKGHVFLSWLHPYKEQKLIVVGDRRMVIFDDMEPEQKLRSLNHTVEWVDRFPVPRMEQAEAVPFAKVEPLRAECRHFLECIATRSRPDTDGEEGVRVLEVLEACQRSLDQKGPAVLPEPRPEPYFAHETAIVEEPSEIGEGTKIWHFSHVMKNARIERDCSIGQNVFIGSDVVVGRNVKIQNNVSLFTGVILEDDVFCGPSMVFTNVTNPRSHISRKHEYRKTIVKKGASLGANCTILCGHTIGRYAFIGAAAVVTSDVPDHALVVGNPGRIVGWMCRCGLKLAFAPDGTRATERAHCLTCGSRYVKRGTLVAEDGVAEPQGAS